MYYVGSTFGSYFLQLTTDAYASIGAATVPPTLCSRLSPGGGAAQPAAHVLQAQQTRFHAANAATCRFGFAVL